MQMRITVLFFLFLLVSALGCASQSYNSLDVPIRESPAEIRALYVPNMEAQRYPRHGDPPRSARQFLMIVDSVQNPTLSQRMAPLPGGIGSSASQDIEYDGDTLTTFYTAPRLSRMEDIESHLYQNYVKEAIFDVQLMVPKVFGFVATIRIYQPKIRLELHPISGTNRMATHILGLDNQPIVSIFAPEVEIVQMFGKKRSSSQEENSISAQFTIQETGGGPRVRFSNSYLMAHVRFPLEMPDWQIQSTLQTVEGSHAGRTIFGFRADELISRETDAIVRPQQPGQFPQLNVVVTMRGGEDVTSDLVFMDTLARLKIEPIDDGYGCFLFVASDERERFRGLIKAQHMRVRSDIEMMETLRRQEEMAAMRASQAQDTPRSPQELPVPPRR